MKLRDKTARFWKRVSRNKRKNFIVAGCFFLFFVLPMFLYDANEDTRKQSKELMDNPNVYNKEVDVKEIYLTVLPPESNFTEYSHSFAELNQDINYKDDSEVKVKVLFQEGENGGPRQGFYGFGLTDANGMMELRGHSTRNAKQKSYRIKLNKKGGYWDGFETINLNKHPFDDIKLRNKLSYEVLKNLNDITSLRTQFVHLYIKDFSEGDFRQGYQDYGLYTHVENVDDLFLKNHNLDPKGSLYKAENFEFFRYPEQLANQEDSNYKQKEFEKVLEIKGDNDHTKLLRMLDDVNNNFNHINDVIAEHFDRNNYLTWLAVNILLGNIDTISQNYYLYSPREEKTWYFLPWDFDGAWDFYEQKASNGKAPWQEGVSNYWGNLLHRRFLQNKQNLDQLSKKIELLATQLTKEDVALILKELEPIVLRYLIRPADQEESPLTQEEIRKELDKLPGVIEKNKEIYYRNIEKPMPVHMANVVNLGTYLDFKWDKAYDLQGDSISYSIDISNSPEFDQIIYHKENIQDAECIVGDMAPGLYYWRLTIRDAKGNTQIAFNIYTRGNTRYFGVQPFLVQ